jgi:hypothetical protein
LANCAVQPAAIAWYRDRTGIAHNFYHLDSGQDTQCIGWRSQRRSRSQTKAARLEMFKDAAAQGYDVLNKLRDQGSTPPKVSLKLAALVGYRK